MSVVRTKSTRPDDKSVRPSTATNRLLRTPTNSKSMIPKYRSLSQPASAQSIKGKAHSMADFSKVEPTKTSFEDMASTTKEPSVKSEDFKDCLDAKSDGVLTEIENKIKIDTPPKETRNTPVKRAILSPKKDVPIKNSSSGIPVSVSSPNGKMPSKPSPKPSPRTPRSPSLLVKKKPTTPQSIPPPTESKQTSAKTLEMFIIKKKRFDQMRRDILDKQKPALELYQMLQQLKQKLEESGKPIVLDTFKVIECEELVNNVVNNTEVTAGGETMPKLLDSETLATLRNMICTVPLGLQALCKTLIDRRIILVDLLEKCLDPNADKESLLSEVQKVKDEAGEIDLTLKSTCKVQDEQVDNIMDKYNTIMKSSDAGDLDVINQLEEKLRKQEGITKELSNELHTLKQQLKEKTAIDVKGYENEISRLNDKITNLEKQIDAEKKKYQHDIERYKNTEISIKTFKSKIKDFDEAKQHYEQRISHLSEDLRSAQAKTKQIEKKYEMEISKLNKAMHLDKSVIERLNKDRATFESRLQSATETAEVLKAEFSAREEELMGDLEEAKNTADVSQNEVEELRKELVELQINMNTLEVQAEQSANIVRKRDPIDGKAETVRECELQIEVVAQRAAIRSLQERIEACTAEKLRFVDTIQKMNGTEGMNDTIVKALVKREEDITKYETILKNNEDLIAKQKMELEVLHIKHDHVSKQLEILSNAEKSGDLKHVLKEGKTKLEQALMKSLENEQKILKYERDISQKNNAIANLENMMKVRDGLIGVIKAKKDELSMENESLTKYSEEIRAYVLQSKEELKQKTEIIQDLQSTVTTKLKEISALEKRVQELEEKLTMTNDKRYKLQETITVMEKELQAAKAQINQFEDMQTRYDPGQEINFSDPADGPVRIKITVQ